MSGGDFEQYHQRLLKHFDGAQRAQLAPLAKLLGVKAPAIRNRGGIITINSVDVAPVKICGRLTYDLREVAEALAAAAPQQLDGVAA